MNSRDRHLGMDRTISRRDFLNGVSVAIGASLLPACTRTGEPIVEGPSAYYPPAEMGMRGSHPGSFEVAHATLQGQHWAAEKTDEHYDLVVVGAGISGLSAAYICRRDVTYVTNNEARTVTANEVVWAGYHAMLPHICPDVPEDQVAALGSSVRAPLVYTNVLIRNWRSLVNLGLRPAYCPGSFFQAVMFTHPVSMGDYHFSQSPDEAVVLHLEHIPLAPGLPAPEQFREGRRALLETAFETFERNVRDQLGRMLGPGRCNPARDIAGITVNRWPHGYAFSIDAESGDVAWWPERWRHERRPWVEARRRVGNITFASTDASSNAMTESAIEEAQRAVHSLMTETMRYKKTP